VLFVIWAVVLGNSTVRKSRWFRERDREKEPQDELVSEEA